MIVIDGPEALLALPGQDIPASSWLEITQGRIDSFARCTEDPQWIHVDPLRAASSPFGTTIAHGFLTLSLIPHFWKETAQITGFSMTVNYGLNRVRFPATVPTGSRIRARFENVEVTPVSGGFQLEMLVTIEREGHPKPVCVAESIIRLMS